MQPWRCTTVAGRCVSDGLIIDIQEFALSVRPGGAIERFTLADRKIGLSDRALGLLLDGLATYLARDQPFLKLTLSLHDVAEPPATLATRSRLRSLSAWAQVSTISSTGRAICRVARASLHRFCGDAENCRLAGGG